MRIGRLGSCNNLFSTSVWPAKSYVIMNGRRLEPSLLQYHTKLLTIRGSGVMRDGNTI